ncbi:diphthine--ammonia ligase [Maudiozyma humilis]|uniref:Diphthine--ammonia ligase n=1 Tax=Maudiozyma humilis TaxID=51915 RepID=A0AAV5S5I5_MAUHU|nr:diphthine--ammonia ligase [Kazachstania humilis]
MKFVALVSGGKDSCYNIIHCLKNGHELAALGNLYPSTNIQELDSFMFQTVGFDVVAQYPNCISNIPLYRQPIEKGTSKNVDLNYIETQDDEIEELFMLLSKIKKDIPDIEAVSVGAILSSYQRTRVENVCNRLNLTVLSYLWQRSQEELMNEMCVMSKQGSELDDPKCAKLDARIIKVAAIGLDDSHLGKTLPQILPSMLKLNRMYDVHICGEGGEFESMVIDAPFFDKGYLHLDDIIHSTENNIDGDGVYSANLKVHCENRSLPDGYLEDQLENLPVPDLFGLKWTDLLDEMKSCPSEDSTHENTEDKLNNNITLPTTVNSNDDLLFISNLHTLNENFTSIKDQMTDIFRQLDDILSKQHVSRSQILNSSLILSQMSDFAAVNAIYNEYFRSSRWGPLPPSRSCIGSSRLGKHVLVQLSVIIAKNHKTRNINESDSTKIVTIDDNKNGLHVQGRSYWAPCNIGPYSQAIWDNNDPNQVSFISGQIALNPANMAMIASDDYYGQAALSLKHFDAIKNCINAKNQLFMTCYISETSMVDIVTNAWRLYSSDMDIRSDHWMDMQSTLMECLIVVKVSELPRSALCEWGGVSCKEFTISNDLDSDSDETEMDENNLRTLVTESEGLSIKDATCRAKVTSNGITRIFSTVFCADEQEFSIYLKNVKSSTQMTVYLNPDLCQDASSLNAEGTLPNITLCPVEQVFDCFGTEHFCAIHFTA